MKNLIRHLSLFALCALLATSLHAQRPTDTLDRGLVVVPTTSGTGNMLSWRVMGEEYYDVTYNVYANGSLLAKGLKVSCYTHAAGTASTTYQVAAVVRGTEQALCEAVTRWGVDSYGMPCWTIPVEEMTGRDGTNTNDLYTLNDVSLGDLTGDGHVEYIIKRPSSTHSDLDNDNAFNTIDVYDRFGNRLWWIDLGPNMVCGVQWDVVAYDWDQDGRAEVLFRGADNMIMHYPDGTTWEIGDMTLDTRYSGQSITDTGNEYLFYLEGATGKPFGEITDDFPGYITFPTPRGNDSDWGGTHRSCKHYYGAPFLDGKTPSIFIGRGAYTKHDFRAFDVNPLTHELTERWHWYCDISSSPWYGNGYHNYAIADVDWDGRDEIVMGSMVIDDNGLGLSTTGLGHGDAQHCSDFDPYRHGQEQFACNETSPNNNYRNATTSEYYYRSAGTSDDGRALMGNFTNDVPGAQGRSVNTGWIAACADKEVDNLEMFTYGILNQRLYWDGDLLEEFFNSPGTEGYGAIYKPGTNTTTSTRWNLRDSKCNNWTKNNAGAIADIWGDWREEVVMRKSDNTALHVYTTNEPTTYRLPTLWHDHQYRQSIVWQVTAYNQPPHPSFFLGELEGITMAPPPLTLTGRTLLTPGSTITTTTEHVLIHNNEDTQYTLDAEASPYILTVNVPSWVQGTAESNTTTKDTEITYDYFTCTLTGGSLAGSTRLVKQGDGTLVLPATEFTHTGETNVWAGTLVFDGSMTQSPLWLNRFATLQTNGGTFRKITADYAATLRPTGTVSTDTLALGFGSRLVMNIDEGTQLNTKLITIETKSGTAWEKYGPEYLTPVLEIEVAKTDGLAPEGDYVLGTVGDISGDLADIKIEGISGQKKSLAITNGQLVLTIQGIRDPTTIYWQGSESTSWDYASTLNFSNGGEADYFVTGDDVILDDAATSFTVSLADELDPASLTVNNTTAYTISGTGALTGSMTLTKQGTGTLTLSTDNSYTGQTTISGGTVKVSSLSNENLAKGNLGAVSTSPLIIEEGAALQTTSVVTMGTPIATQGDEGGVLNNSTTFNMNASISGTLLTKKGNGTLVTYAGNSSLASLVITAGAVQAIGGMPAQSVAFQGGTLYDDASATTHDIYVAKGKTGTWNLTSSKYVYYANKLTGSGTLTIIPRNTSSRVSIKGDWSDFEGTIQHTTTDIWLPLNMSGTASHATLYIASGCTVTNVAQTLTLGAVTGSGTLAQPISNFSSQTTQTGTNTWQIGNSDSNNFTFAGAISDDPDNSRYCAFVKVGTCKMTFTGLGTFNSTAKVSAGELVLNNSSTTTPMLGYKTLTVSSGATLSGKGLLANTATTVAKGGTLRSGISETATTGNLRFSGNNVTVNGTIQTYIGSKSSYSKFTDIGTLKLGSAATLCVKGKDGLALAEGTEITIFNDVATITIDDATTFDLCEPNATLGLTWDTSRLATEGVLVVGPAPEGIRSLADKSLRQADIFTLSGHRATGLRQGIYIVDGVKTLLR